MDTKTGKPEDTRMIVQLTASELRTLVRDEVDRAVTLVLEATPTAARSERWIDVTGAAKHFKVTPGTIRNWIAAGAPCRRLGPTHHLIRIDLAEFEDWVQLRDVRRPA